MKRLAILCGLGLGLAALSTIPVRAAAAGCCQLPQQEQTSKAESTAEGTPFPFPFPFPFPRRGCFQTDSSELCEALGGVHYQLGICGNGICQPTAAGADKAVFDPDAELIFVIRPVKPHAH